jgi:hypothetical protein
MTPLSTATYKGTPDCEVSRDIVIDVPHLRVESRRAKPTAVMQIFLTSLRAVFGGMREESASH